MKNGNLSSFSHLVIGDGGNLVASGTNNSHYDIPNQFVEWREATNGIRLKHWRSVGHGPNKFAIECMLDEIARDQGKDPIQFRKTLMIKFTTGFGYVRKNSRNFPIGVLHQNLAEQKELPFVEHGSLGSAYVRFHSIKNLAKSVFIIFG